MSGFYLSRNFTHNWLEALFDTVKSPFEVSLSLLCLRRMENCKMVTIVSVSVTTGSIIDGLRVVVRETGQFKH